MMYNDLNLSPWYQKAAIFGPVHTAPFTNETKTNRNKNGVV